MKKKRYIYIYKQKKTIVLNKNLQDYRIGENILMNVKIL